MRIPFFCESLTFGAERLLIPLRRVGLKKAIVSFDQYLLRSCSNSNTGPQVVQNTEQYPLVFGSSYMTNIVLVAR
jgi:hypothetical protein